MICLHLLWQGLSLKSQVLTAIFLAVRVFCSFIMEGDIHTILDFVTLAATLWVIYMMKFKLKSSFMADLDSMHYWYLVNTIFPTAFCCPDCYCNRTLVLYWSLFVICIARMFLAELVSGVMSDTSHIKHNRRTCFFLPCLQSLMLFSFKHDIVFHSFPANHSRILRYFRWT